MNQTLDNNSQIIGFPDNNNMVFCSNLTKKQEGGGWGSVTKKMLKQWNHYKI